MPTTTDYLTQAESDRQDFIDNLEEQGISDLTGDETFTELVPKVLDIEGGGSGRLPSAYQEVEYIGITSGNGYINTGFKPTYNTKVEARATVTTGWLCGEDTSWQNKGFGILKNYSYFSNKYTSIDVNDNIHDFITSKDGYYVDETLRDSFSGASTFTATNNLYIYANNRNGNVTEYGKGNLYTFKIYESNVLVHNLIPCYRKSDEVIGLYDLNDEEFLSPTGSGTWTKGNNVTGLNLQTKSATITTNTTTSIIADSGYDGLETVNVTTNVTPNLQAKSETITSNTTTTILPDNGYDGLSSVSVTTNVSGGNRVIYLIKDGEAVMQPCNYTRTDSTGVVGSFTENYNNEGFARLTAKTWSEYHLTFGTIPIEEGSRIGITFKKDNAWTGQYSQYGGCTLDLVPQSGTTLRTKFASTNTSYSKGTIYLTTENDYTNFYLNIQSLADSTSYGIYGVDVYDLWIEPPLSLQEKSVTITQNGLTEITPDTGYDGMSKVNVTNNIPLVPTFSTTETVVGTWIDDKPLYMKTYSQDITVNSSGAFDVNIAHGLTGTGIMFLGENSFVGLTSDMSQSYPINYTNTTSNTYSSLLRTQVSTNGNIRVMATTSTFTANISVTAVINVFYTKSTDTAVSSANQVRGLNFSETEHEVGTDTNGDIIYEKTVPKSGSYGYPNPFNQSVAHNISNAKKIWISNGTFFYSSSQSASNRFYLPLNYIHSNTDKSHQFARCSVTSSNINIYVGDYIFGIGDLYTYTTLRYTKNTA